MVRLPLDPGAAPTPFGPPAPGYGPPVVGQRTQDAVRVAHDVGLAIWVGGSLFGRSALGPAVARVTSTTERGEVLTTAWGRWGPVDGIALAAVAGGWLAARLSDVRARELTPRERSLARAKDALVAASLVTGAGSAVLGGRLRRQAPDGAVPVERGEHPAPETPPRAARIQRLYAVMGPANIAAGLGVVAVTALLAQESRRRPPRRRQRARR